MLILATSLFAQSPIEKTQEFKTILSEARKGNEHYQVNLGYLYANGRGVEQNYAKAVKWYTLAAKQGNMIAQNNLG